MHTEFLDGPDFLNAVADAETAHGNDINAAEYRKRARQWQLCQAERDEAVRERDDLRERMAAAAQKLAA